MSSEPSWMDLGLRAVNLGRTVTHGELPRRHDRRVERVLVTDDTGRVSKVVVTDEPENLAA